MEQLWQLQPRFTFYHIYRTAWSSIMKVIRRLLGLSGRQMENIQTMDADDYDI